MVLYAFIKALRFLTILIFPNSNNYFRVSHLNLIANLLTGVYKHLNFLTFIKMIDALVLRIDNFISAGSSVIAF